MKKLQINVFDTDLVWWGLIEEVESFTHRSSWHEIVNSEIRISRKAAHFNQVQIGRILVVNNQLDQALIIEEITAAADDPFITCLCVSLKGMLNYRVLTEVDSGDYVNSRQGNVMSNIVRDQLITQTRDPKRYFTNTSGQNILTVAANKPIGSIIDYLTQNWDTGYLGDVITDIANMNESGEPIGWNISIKDDFSGFIFDTFEAVDRSRSQFTNPPVIFSDDFANIKNLQYIVSNKEWKTHAYVTYEDVNGNPVYIGLGSSQFAADSSFERREIIIDSNQSTYNAASYDGRSELNNRPKIRSISAEVLENPNTLTNYRKDWNLGDIVTIQSKILGITMDAQILEIEEIYADDLYSINVTFGEGKPPFTKILKRAFNRKRKG